MKYALYILAFFCISGTVIYQGVRTNNTLTGAGIDGDELKVDTSKIATVYDLAETRTYKNAISPSQITSDQDNYNPSGWDAATIIRLDGDNGIRAITSMAAPTSTVVPQTKILSNVGSYPIYFPMDHPDGTAANRLTGCQGDFYLRPGQTIRITYDATLSRWLIEGSGVIDYPAPHSSYYYVPASSSATGDHNVLNFTAISTGTAGTVSGTANNPPYWQLSTSTGSTSGYNLNFIKSPAQVGYTGSSALAYETQVFVTTLSDGTETYQAHVAITASQTGSTNTPNNTIGIRYSHSINSGKWEAFTIDGSAGTSSQDLGVTVAVNTIYTLRIELDKARSEARFYINGAYKGRITGNLPANATQVGVRSMILKSAGTTARVLGVNYMMAKSIYP